MALPGDDGVAIFPHFEADARHIMNPVSGLQGSLSCGHILTALEAGRIVNPWKGRHYGFGYPAAGGG